MLIPQVPRNLLSFVGVDTRDFFIGIPQPPKITSYCNLTIQAPYSVYYMCSGSVVPGPRISSRSRRDPSDPQVRRRCDTTIQWWPAGIWRSEDLTDLADLRDLKPPATLNPSAILNCINNDTYRP